MTVSEEFVMQINRRYERPWMKPVLLAAGVYNLAWGAVSIAFPSLLFDALGMEPPRYPELWQCIGMIVGVYGIGYAIAAFDPLRHWPVVLVGFLGKVFGPLGFLGAVLKGSLPVGFGATILTNDLIWWLPFGAILWAAFKANTTVVSTAAEDGSHALDTLKLDEGPSLATASRDQPLFAVLLRHAGCTFHREALADLKAAEPAVASAGARLAVVHMGEGTNTVEVVDPRYDLSKASHVADPELRLYRELGLPRGTFGQLFGWKELSRGVSACILKGHGVGTLQGDGFQLGGLALIHGGEVVWSRPLKSASERPDYAAAVAEAMQSAGSATTPI